MRTVRTKLLAARWIASFLAAASAAPAHAQQASTPIPDWVERFLSLEPQGEKFGRAWLQRADAVRRAGWAADHAPAEGAPTPPPGVRVLTGTFAMPVLAATYSDVTPAYPSTAYEQLFFGAAGAGINYTVSQFFSEASGGAFKFTGIVTPWIVLTKPRTYYNDPTLGVRGRWIEYMQDVLVRADSSVDWRQFDNDGPDNVPNSGDDDGYVDMVTFLHPLGDGVCISGALAGPVATGFQLHRVSGAFTTSRVGFNGQKIKVDDFILSGGLHCNGSSIASMNINVHETGHALGLPDLNDLDRSSYGVGAWDVMGYGLYALDGRPSQLGAWSRRQLGWAVPTTITKGAHLTIPAAGTSRESYRIGIPGTQEYFLLENRQRVGADASLPGTGLAVWHVDDVIMLPAVQQYKGTEDESRPGLAVVEADGRRDIVLKKNTGDSGDLFPGSTVARTVGDSTTPSLRLNTGALSGVSLRNIVEAGGIITVDACISTLNGDVTGDALMNVLDAQQIARASVGLSVTDAARVTTNGDVNGDGRADIVDAQQLARYSVGLTAVSGIGRSLPGCPL